MWQGMTAASPPLARMFSATASHASALRLDTTTLAPCSARRSAMARPMPLLDPVTMATFPVRSNNDITFPSLATDCVLAMLPTSIVCAGETSIRTGRCSQNGYCHSVTGRSAFTASSTERNAMSAPRVSIKPVSVACLYARSADSRASATTMPSLRSRAIVCCNTRDPV